MKLYNVCDYVTERIDSQFLTTYNYISTENMLPNKEGITYANNIPKGNVIAYNKGDILISNIRPYFKKIWQANINGGCSSDVLCIRAKSTVSSKFLFYLLSQQSFFDYVMSGSKGCKMPRGDKQQIMQWDIELPTLEEQITIANILSSLDDKIELNRRINENLEQQAQALFKSWFVDFEPFKDGKFVDSELGMIPEGWKVVETNKFMKISRNSINPTKNPNIFYAHYSIPAYDETGLPIFQYGDEIKSNKQEVADNMTLVSKLNPRIKRVWFVEKACENAICSTEFIPYQSLNNSPYFLYCYLNSKIFYDSIMASVNGATGSHQRFQANDTLMYLFPYNEEIIYKFNTIVSGIMIHKSRLIRENMKLAQLRDTLLPKLMSGELKLSEIETELDE